MRCLVLFCGTKSFSKRLLPRGHSVITLDIDPKTNADIVTDVCDWDYKRLGPFDYIHASPVCTQFSVALTTKPRDIEKGLRLVRKTLEIIGYFLVLNPKLKFTIENPASGKDSLYKQPLMKNICRAITSYCVYGYSYRKHTCFHNNFGLVLKPVCKWDCHASYRSPETNRMCHKLQCCNSRGAYSLKQKYSIPPTLIDDILDQIE